MPVLQTPPLVCCFMKTGRRLQTLDINKLKRHCYYYCYHHVCYNQGNVRLGKEPGIDREPSPERRRRRRRALSPPPAVWGRLEWMDTELEKHTLKPPTFQLQQQPPAITPHQRELSFLTREQSFNAVLCRCIGHAQNLFSCLPPQSETSKSRLIH